jgi:hypothetical protein
MADYSFSPQFATLRSESPLAGMRPITSIPHSTLSFKEEKPFQIRSAGEEKVALGAIEGISKGVDNALKGITAAYVGEREKKEKAEDSVIEHGRAVQIANIKAEKTPEEKQYEEDYRKYRIAALKGQVDKQKEGDKEETIDYGTFEDVDAAAGEDLENLDPSGQGMWNLGLPSETEDVLNPLSSIGPTQQDVQALWNKQLSELTANVDIQKQAGALADMQAGNLTPAGASMSTDTQAPEKPASFNILSKNKSLISPEEARRIQEEFYATTTELPTGFGALSALPKPEQQQVLAEQKVDEQDLNRYFKTWGDPNVAIKAQKKISEILGPEYHEAKIEQIKTKKGETGFKVLFPEKKTIDQLKKEKEALNPQPGMSKDQIGVYDKLYANVQQNPLIKNAIDAKSSSEIILSSLSENNGFGDITAINAFQRMVDPGVAVREGDVTLLQSAIPRLRALGLTVGNLVEGDKLTFQAREQLKQLSKKLANTRITSSQQAISDLREIAKDAGINPDRVIRELKVEVPESENLVNSARQLVNKIKQMPEGSDKEALKAQLREIQIKLKK